ncbi:AbrB/MazE/SpoVT family DNA-binding domain-containing protein [Cytobacillus sp. Hz8]|uniref:AbrB/MazE/SpoVT family DNA-binding domain-containing protein n=1 Tax=Cytobacillus sp. Hz8 TaxID=3347168 RepID=UPI0035D64935
MQYYKKPFKSGQITIPKRIQTYLDFSEGEYLFIYVFKNRIEVVKQHHNKTLNQCVFGHGKISIPIELRRLLGITTTTLLKLQINRNQDKLIITIMNQDQILK